MNSDGSLALVESAETDPPGSEFRSKIGAMICGAGLVVFLGAAAVTPQFEWYTIVPHGIVEQESRGITVSGRGRITYKETVHLASAGPGRIVTARISEDMTSATAPHGMPIQIAGVAFAAVAVGAVFVLLLPVPRDVRQRLLRIALNTCMIGAIALCAWHVHWLWKIKSMSMHVEKFGVWHGAMTHPGLGVYLGICAGILAALCVMGMASATLQHPQRWMRFGEIGGFIAGGLTLLVVLPWDGEGLWAAMQEVRERRFGI